jgi:hypothetical protein
MYIPLYQNRQCVSKPPRTNSICPEKRFCFSFMLLVGIQFKKAFHDHRAKVQRQDTSTWKKKYNLSNEQKHKWYVSFWLIVYLWFYVPFKNFSLIWRRHHSRWRAAKFRLDAHCRWAGMYLYRATPAMTQDLGFSSFIQRTEAVLQSPIITHEGMWRVYSNPDPHRLSLWSFFAS